MTAPAGEPLPIHDPRALGALLKALEPRLVAFALRFTRDGATAEDVVQSAFEKAIRHGHRFRGDARVSTWLHRIVANEALMWLRRRRRRPADLDPGAPGAELARLADPAPGALELLARREALERLRAGLGALPDAERDVLAHCVLAERSYAEFGRERGLHPGAVKSRAFRARRRLGEALRSPPPPGGRGEPA